MVKTIFVVVFLLYLERVPDWMIPDDGEEENIEHFPEQQSPKTDHEVRGQPGHSCEETGP